MSAPVFTLQETQGHRAIYTGVINGRRITMIVEAPKPEAPPDDSEELIFAVLNCDLEPCPNGVPIRDADKPNVRRFCCDSHRYAQRDFERKMLQPPESSAGARL